MATTSSSVPTPPATPSIRLSRCRQRHQHRPVRIADHTAEEHEPRIWSASVPATKKCIHCSPAASFAVLANVGPLNRPTTKAAYLAGTDNPYQLFSHADQQAQWQTTFSDEPSRTGWVADSLTP